MIDIRGNEFQVGDTIAYAGRRFSSTSLKVATIDALADDGRIFARTPNGRRVRIRNLDTVVIVERKRTEEELSLADQVLAAEAEGAVYKRQRDEAKAGLSHVGNMFYRAVRDLRRAETARAQLMDDVHALALALHPVERSFGLLRRLAAIFS